MAAAAVFHFLTNRNKSAEFPHTFIKFHRNINSSKTTEW